uniref:Coat protein n=1 Tax=White ash mosaic virus TaxID=375547 RepID=D7PQV2_9VIRU|nr:coat protein [White ash mosaic virus]
MSPLTFGLPSATPSTVTSEAYWSPSGPLKASKACGMEHYKVLWPCKTIWLKSSPYSTHLAVQPYQTLKGQLPLFKGTSWASPRNSLPPPSICLQTCQQPRRNWPSNSRDWLTWPHRSKLSSTLIYSGCNTSTGGFQPFPTPLQRQTPIPMSGGFKALRGRCKASWRLYAKRNIKIMTMGRTSELSKARLMLFKLYCKARTLPTHLWPDQFYPHSKQSIPLTFAEPLDLWFMQAMQSLFLWTSKAAVPRHPCPWRYSVREDLIILTCEWSYLMVESLCTPSPLARALSSPNYLAMRLPCSTNITLLSFTTWMRKMSVMFNQMVEILAIRTSFRSTSKMATTETGLTSISSTPTTTGATTTAAGIQPATAPLPGATATLTSTPPAVGPLAPTSFAPSSSTLNAPSASGITIPERDSEHALQLPSLADLAGRFHSIEVNKVATVATIQAILSTLAAQQKPSTSADLADLAVACYQNGSSRLSAVTGNSASGHALAAIKGAVEKHCTLRQFCMYYAKVCYNFGRLTKQPPANWAAKGYKENSKYAAFDFFSGTLVPDSIVPPPAEGNMFKPSEEEILAHNLNAKLAIAESRGMQNQYSTRGNMLGMQQVREAPPPPLLTFTE